MGIFSAIVLFQPVSFICILLLLGLFPLGK